MGGYCAADLLSCFSLMQKSFFHDKAHNNTCMNNKVAAYVYTCYIKIVKNFLGLGLRFSYAIHSILLLILNHHAL